MELDEINISMLKIDNEKISHDIVSMEISLEVNRHGKLCFSCILRQPESKREEGFLGTKIKLSYDKEGIEHTLFAGYIMATAIRVQGDITYADITAMSGSIKFDKERKCRSFQDMTQTYGEIFEEIAGRGRAVFAVGRGRERLTAPIIQYEETDWQFINRIAGRWNTIVIPETTNVFPQIAVGIIAGKEYDFEEEQDYCTAVHYGYFRKQKEKRGSIDEFREYRISTGRDIQLGDKVQFKDQKWTVVEKQIKLDKGVLKLSYCLGKENGRSRFIRNEKLCGLSLEGNVIEREGEKLKISLDIDEGRAQKSSGIYAYDYVPITGNLMYSMPEKNARVSLYFPGTEETGMVINCIQRNIEYTDHKMKVMEMPTGPQLQMTPRQVSIFTRKQSSSMKISDRDGIIFKSRSVIRITAKNTISLKAKNLQLVAGSRIYMESKSSGDFIEMAGRQMYYHASHSVLSAIKHKTVKSSGSVKNYAVIKDLELVALAVMGGLRAGNMDKMEAKVEAGIPILCNANASFMRNLASISWKRTI